MRKIGLQVIKLVSLIRYYKFFPGLNMFFTLLFGGGNSYVINSKVFLKKIYLRKSQSDPFIFEQVFAEQQYQFDHPAPDRVKWIIDAGANIGLAAIFFSMKFPNAKIISIEPNKDNFELLKKNTSGYKNVHCIHAALWHRNEKLDISNKEQLSAGYMMTEIKDDAGEFIEAVTVNQLIEEFKIDSISIFKIDIEGSEKEIFQYNSDSWLQRSDCVIAELHDWLKPGTSQVFFKEMAAFDWVTYIRGENIVCLKSSLFPSNV